MIPLRLLIILVIFSLISCVKNNPKTDVIHKVDVKEAESYQKKAKHFYKNYVHDSAFYYYHKALEIYQSAKNPERTADMFFKLAVVSNHMADYAESNYYATQMLRYAQQNEQKFRAFNVLGINNKELFLYKDALQYYDSVKKYLAVIDQKFTVGYYNNCGLLYTKMEHFDQALVYFDSVLKTSNISNREKNFAQALDNKGMALFKLNRFDEALSHFQKAFDIRKQINDEPGLLMSYLHLATYYKAQNIGLAQENINKALELSYQINDQRDRLDALKQLMQINPTQTGVVLNQYFTLQNKVLEEERKFKNFAAYIKYDTEKKESKIMAQQKIIKKRNSWIMLGVFSFVIVLAVLHIINETKKKFKLKNIEIAKINQELTEQKNLLQQANLQLADQKKTLQHHNTVLTQQNELIEKLKHDIHHRVYNDLKKVQIFIGLENKAKRNGFLNELDGKIDAMMLAHAQLLSNKSYGKVNMNDYLRDLLRNRYQLYADKDKKIDYQVNVNIELDSHQAILVGLIVSELLTNTYKHAFSSTTHGEINLQFYLNPDTNQYQLDYSDNGKGYTQQEEQSVKPSLGITLIHDFAEQLEGKLMSIPTPIGVHYQLQFKTLK